MCSSCCDDLPPVLDGPYSTTGGRAGSAFGGVADAVPLIQNEVAEEVSTAALEKQVLFALPVVQLADTDD